MAETRDTEDIILDAARKVFVELGPVNARMKDVADEADITQSLLHYYFRKRDELYRAVFQAELKRIMPKQVYELKSDAPLTEKLEAFARGVIDVHAENPHLAAFVLFETHYNDEHFDEIREALAGLDLDVLQRQIDERVEAGDMEPTRAEHLLTNVLALALFPFVARPILQSVYDMDEDDYRAFIEERKDAVPQFVKRAMNPCE
jgi:AcrR family transcriptional regulator